MPILDCFGHFHFLPKVNFLFFFDKVNLIKPVSNVRPSVRTHASIRPQNVSLISMKFGTWLEVDE